MCQNHTVQICVSRSEKSDNNPGDTVRFRFDFDEKSIVKILFRSEKSHNFCFIGIIRWVLFSELLNLEHRYY